MVNSLEPGMYAWKSHVLYALIQYPRRVMLTGRKLDVNFYEQSTPLEYHVQQLRVFIKKNIIVILVVIAQKN